MIPFSYMICLAKNFSLICIKISVKMAWKRDYERKQMSKQNDYSNWNKITANKLGGPDHKLQVQPNILVEDQLIQLYLHTHKLKA